MLKKLLKYELKNIYKFLIIFYSLSLFFGILTRIFLSIDNSLMMEIIGQVCSGAAISMMFSILINNLMRSWVRFKQNVYGDESYLTHTLPLDKKTIYLSKILTAIITLFTSITVIGLTLFIAYYSKENLELVKNLLLPLADIFNSTMFKILIAILLVLFLELANVLQSGYAGIIIGHKKNNNKIGFSVLFGFITYIISQLFAVLVMFIISLFNKEMMNLFITNELINVEMIKYIIYIAIIIYTLNLIIIYFVNIKLFKKGVNVE